MKVRIFSTIIDDESNTGQDTESTEFEEACCRQNLPDSPSKKREALLEGNLFFFSMAVFRMFHLKFEIGNHQNQNL